MSVDSGMDPQLANHEKQTLSRRRKAAMVVQILIADGDALALHELPQELQLLLTQELGHLRRIDKGTVAAVAEEFAAELDAIGFTAPGTHDAAVNALASHLSPELAEKLRRQTAQVRNGDHWPDVTGLTVAQLTDIMGRESIMVCAVTLSKLPVAKAAEVLAHTPGDRARRITYAMRQTADVSPRIVQQIGAALAQEYGRAAALAFDKAPVQRLGAILNAAQTDTREDVLVALGTEDPDFATDVRKAIFTFKDIASRVKPTDVPNCLRNVDGAVLITAIAAALAADQAHVDSAEFILQNLSQRMAGQLREDAGERGKVKKSEAETALAEVTKVIREMADSEAITLRDPEENEEDQAA